MNIIKQVFLNLFSKNNNISYTKGNYNLDTLMYKANSYNGYEREKAIKQLSELGNPEAIPTLLFRVNDWVPQVREASVKSINLPREQFPDPWVDSKIAHRI